MHLALQIKEGLESSFKSSPQPILILYPPPLHYLVASLSLSIRSPKVPLKTRPERLMAGRMLVMRGDPPPLEFLTLADFEQMAPHPTLRESNLRPLN